MNKNITILAAVGVIYWLYKSRKSEQSTQAFLSGGDYNEIFRQQWWS